MAAVKRNGRRLVAEINVVPYIDVMLVLLVVFMVTAPMMTQGVKVDLPDAAAQPLKMPDEDDLITVSVDSQGQYYLTLGGDKQSPKPLVQVADTVGKIVKAKPQSNVFVEGDGDVAYQHVVALMAALQAVGVTNIGLVTEAPQPKPGSKK